MSLDAFGIVQPGQNLGAGDVLSNHFPDFTGVVEETVERVSRISPYVDIKTVTGTSTITQEGVGESTLSVIVPGVTPDQTSPNQFNQNSLTVDTTVLARTILPMLDVFQKKYDVRAAIAREHGKKIGKLFDTSFAIAAIKSARMATNTYALPGYEGGSQVTLTNAGQATDPASLYSAISDVLAQMELKDVDPQSEGVIVALRPDKFYALQEAEQIVNGNYVTANGQEINNVKMLKAYGVPVISTNSVPNTNITGHQLSNARNQNFYDGDYTKVVATVFSSEALLAGQTIPLQTKVWFDDVSKHWFIDAWLAWAATVNRNEYAGIIQLP